ncbi:MAG: iron-containing alcohol dehydrogenase [Candidatus Thermoplasmatota archaeon]|nr:iron-containing alcohol dehydrogenase [Candidatus Thermoplasmatota archaeon]MCL5438304.1 iron-containing alcohol dehydrogenase [Candidatus Thermoplasmatota archaeon]
MWFFRSPEVVFGEDSLSFLSNLDRERFLIVTDRFLATTTLPGLLKESIGSNRQFMTFAGIGEEPNEDEILSSISDIREFNPEVVIGMGGGSAIDSAKIIYALNEREDLTPFDITPLEEIGLGKKSILVAVPTTSGTGSDCSWAAVFSGSKEKRKNEVASPEILPRYSILDPSMVLSLPPEQTRNTATDAITHAVEAYGSHWRNPYSDAMAEKSLELITGSLTEVIEDPTNVFHRGNVHVGASMAGMAFSNSQVGLAHALGHALGARFRIAHGKAVGLFLPSVVKFNYGAVKERYDRLNMIFPKKFRKESLDRTLTSYFLAIGQAVSVKSAGLDGNEYALLIDEMTDLAMESTGVLTNPADSDKGRLKEFFGEVI